MVYSPSLLDDGPATSSGGQKSSGGRTNSPSGGSFTTGGRSSGGATSGGAGNGGALANGGMTTGGAVLGGDGNEAGASSDGGTDNGSGGRVTSGGAPNGGASSGGGNGSGGKPGLTGPGPWLIDDLSTGDSYTRTIFGGNWERYAQDGAVWVEETVFDMVQSRPDDEENMALRVEATSLDEWGVDVRITLNGGNDFLDLSPYTGIRVSAHTLIPTENKIRVAIEDSVSNYSACDSSSSCDKHIEYAATSSISSSTFTVVQLPFTSFTTKPSPRTAGLDLTKVYAIHIKMDPAATDVDFFVDDVYLY
jgi:hypothetical protein